VACVGVSALVDFVLLISLVGPVELLICLVCAMRYFNFKETKRISNENGQNQNTPAF